MAPTRDGDPFPEPVPSEASAASHSRATTYLKIGLASWYGTWHQGKRTASGARFDMNALTAAHPTLPFGTRVLVENLSNGRSVTVQITDRGPYVGARVIDLSMLAAAKLDLKKDGVGLVRLSVIADQTAGVETAAAP